MCSMMLPVRCALLTALVYIIMLLSAVTYADNGLHDEGNIDEADYCAACHRAHTAGASKLLLSGGTQAAFCYTCHGTGQSGADTNVQDGEYTGGLGLRGGGFENAVMDTGLTGTPVSAAVTSSHSIDNSVQRAWGGGPVSGTPDYGNTLSLECGDCHNPHGNGNYRLLRGNPEGMYNEGSAAAVDVADEGNITYTISYTTENYRDTSYAPSDTGNWCAQCHTRYSADTGDGHVDSGDAVYAFRHNTSEILDGCLRCHVAHGTSASMGTYSGAVDLPDGTAGGGAGDSRLLSTNNRTICVDCHDTNGQIGGHGGMETSICNGCHQWTTVHPDHGAIITCTGCHDLHDNRPFEECYQCHSVD